MKLITTTVLLILFLGCKKGLEKENSSTGEGKIEQSTSNFKKYISTLDQIQLPLTCNPNGALPKLSQSYDKKKFEIYKHNWAIKPLGIYYKDDNSIGVIDCSVGDFGLVPILTTFDLNGNKVDSTSFYKTTGIDMGYEGIEHLTFNADKKIIVHDTLKRWDFDYEKSKVIESSIEITTGKVEYQILKNGKIEKKLIEEAKAEAKHFDLSTISKSWIRLTKNDEKLVIYNSCDLGNLLITISDSGKKQSLLLHGQQEDYDFSISNSYELNDTIFIDAKSIDSEEKQNFKFIWTDKESGLGRWTTTYSSELTTDHIFVISEKQNNFETIDQPCKECWGDECDEIESETKQTGNPIASIRTIFNGFTEYQESTDSQENKKLIKTSLEILDRLTQPKDLDVLINVWLYYDPTDFPSRDLVYDVLEDSRPESIIAVQHRIENKMEWERDNSAPYSELGYLLEKLKKNEK